MEERLNYVNDGKVYLNVFIKSKNNKNQESLISKCVKDNAKKNLKNEDNVHIDDIDELELLASFYSKDELGL